MGRASHCYKIMKLFLSTLFGLAFSAGFLFSATLTALPSPVAQGGMIHINVAFLDQPTDPFDVHLDSGAPILQPLSLWNPGDSFDPSDPWYPVLDPSQQGRAFNSQYGFLIDGANSDPLPAGTSLGVRLLSASPGLTAYFYRATDGNEVFEPVFTVSHDYVLWSGSMWHPIFTAADAGSYSATFEFFLADVGIGSTPVDYTTQASEMPGYALGQVTLHWSAVPEPTAAGLVGLGLSLVWLARTRRVS